MSFEIPLLVTDFVADSTVITSIVRLKNILFEILGRGNKTLNKKTVHTFILGGSIDSQTLLW